MKWGRKIDVREGIPNWMEEVGRVNVWKGDNSGEVGNINSLIRRDGVTDIQLPSGHWSYEVLDARMTPWTGGDAPPQDLALYGRVMFRNGDIKGLDNTAGAYTWIHLPTQERWEIIGYDRVAQYSSPPTFVPFTPPIPAEIPEPGRLDMHARIRREPNPYLGYNITIGIIYALAILGALHAIYWLTGL